MTVTKELTQDDRLRAQRKLSLWGLLDPPLDGKWGAQSRSALETFQELFGVTGDGILDDDAIKLVDSKGAPPALKGTGFVKTIADWYLKEGWFIARGLDTYNITYIEGINPNFTLNSDRLDEWNDLRILWQCEHSGNVALVRVWKATTEPGAYYTYNKLNAKGAARIKFGQYFSWQVGIHGSIQRHEALVQCAPIEVYRDANEDGKRVGDALDSGLFGVNQHAGMGSSIGRWSAGCLVVPSFEWHADFMSIIKRDRRYKANNGYMFGTAIIPGNELVTFAAKK